MYCFYTLPVFYCLSVTLIHVTSGSLVETSSLSSASPSSSSSSSPPLSSSSLTVSNVTEEGERRSYKGYSVLRLTPTSNDQLDFLRSLELKDPEVKS